MRGMIVVGVLAFVASTNAGCAFLAKRGKDFGQVFRVQAGAGLGLGFSIRAAGVADLGIGGAMLPASIGLGWVYGEGYAFGAGGPRVWREAYWPITRITRFGDIGGGWHWNNDAPAGEAMQHFCWAGLPAFFAAEEPNQVAVPFPLRSDWSKIHAFDLEFGMYFGVLGVRFGLSPGEFWDFIAGWWGGDPAHDDGEGIGGP